MKNNLMVISSLALAVISGSALADMNGGEVQFSGVVTDTTCDINLVENGVDTHVIQLGSVAVTKQSTPVVFTLQPSTKCVAVAGAGAGAGAQQAVISFTGGFDAMGLSPLSGTATDARLKLTAVNSVTPNTEINKSNNSTAFSLVELNKGASFNALLKAGSISGDYHSALVYAVTYK